MEGILEAFITRYLVFAGSSFGTVTTLCHIQYLTALLGQFFSSVHVPHSDNYYPDKGG